MGAAQFDLKQMFEIILAVVLGLAAFTGALIAIAKNSKTMGEWWQTLRVTSCPNHPMICNNLGGLIVFYCAFSHERGHIPPFEKVWLDAVMKDYENTDQNHGVKAVYDEACKLPSAPSTKRRSTDS